MAKAMVKPSAQTYIILEQSNGHITVEMTPMTNSNGSLPSSETFCSKSEHNGLRRPIYFLYGVCALLTFAIFGTSFYFNHKLTVLELTRDSKVRYQESYPFCLSCNELKDSYLKLTRISMTKTASGQCCVQPDDFEAVSHLHTAFVKQITQEERENPGTKTQSNKKGVEVRSVIKPAAHVCYRATSARSSDVVDQWQASGNSTGHRCYTRGDVKLEHGKYLVIPESGYYFVYSKVQYTLEPMENLPQHMEAHDYVSMRVQLEDGLSHIEELLLQSTDTRTMAEVHEKEHEYGTLTDMGRFYFNNGDKIYVEVSKNAKILSEPTYFWLYKT